MTDSLSPDRSIGVGVFKAGARARELVNRVLDTGRISYGPMSREFERQLSGRHGALFGVLSNSGTSSLLVALQAMKEIHGWSDGDEVIIPATTFVATVNVVIWNNLEPVFVDVDPQTYNIDPQLIEAKVTDRTRCIIPVHLFGQPADMTAIMAIAARHELKVIEDSCECMFAEHNGKTVGGIGDIGCFSTYVAHLISSGVGGMSITNNPDYARAMRSLVNHGRDGIYLSIDDDDDQSIIGEVMRKRFRFERVGHSFRITELEAALALGQLENADRMIVERQSNANVLTLMLNDLRDKIQLPFIEEENTHSFMMYPIMILDEAEDKWGLCEHLEKQGIETREMLPLVNQPVYKDRINPGRYPVSQRIVKSGFYVGIHQELGVKDMMYISDAIHEHYKR